MRSGLIGYGYWGKIVHSKLNNCIINPPYDDVDWIFVTTPTNSHFNIVKEYLNKGKNIFCEKPLTLSVEQTQELIDLSISVNKKLYVDNLFLLRNEIKYCNLFPKKVIEFNWYKNGPFKDTIFNDLLYHDLYLLIYFLGVSFIENLKINKNTHNQFKISFIYKDVLVKIEYNREYTGNKTKIIKIDDYIIDLSTPTNDPLMESIQMCFENKIDYVKNHQMTLETTKLLTYFYD
jgi:predicted dehydrogenase